MRIARLSIALFWFVWTSVIIPAHTRGEIQLPGSASCCHPSEKSSDGQSKSSLPGSSNCAVCQFSAHLMPVVTVPVDFTPGEFVEQIAIASPARPFLVALNLPNLTRGPPTMA